MLDILILQLITVLVVFPTPLVANKSDAIDGLLMCFLINTNILGATTDYAELAILTSYQNLLHITIIIPAFDQSIYTASTDAIYLNDRISLDIATDDPPDCGIVLASCTELVFVLWVYCQPVNQLFELATGSFLAGLGLGHLQRECLRLFR